MQTADRFPLTEKEGKFLLYLISLNKHFSEPEIYATFKEQVPDRLVYALKIMKFHYDRLIWPVEELPEKFPGWRVYSYRITNEGYEIAAKFKQMKSNFSDS